MTGLSQRLDDLAARTAQDCGAIWGEDFIRQALDEAVKLAGHYRGRPPERITPHPPTGSVADDNAAARDRVTPDRPTGTSTALFGGAGESITYDPVGNAWDAVLIARMAGMSCGDELLRIAGIRTPADPRPGGLRLVTDEAIHNVRLNERTIVSDCGRSWPAVTPWADALTTPRAGLDDHEDRCDVCRPDTEPQQV